MEISIPVLMSKIVDVGIPQKNIHYVLIVGAIMVLISLCSLTFGVFSAKFGANTSIGFVS